MKAPMRVGAILSSSPEEVRFLGYGTYVGDEMGSGLPFPNPKIELDNGEVVWGCECWWGPEENIRHSMEGKTVVKVNMEQERAVAANEKSES